MTENQPSRRDLMKPLQLVGLAFVAALFAGGVTLVSMGFFQSKPVEEAQDALVLALIVAGIVFIATLLIVSLLLLVVDPAQVATPVDRPVLYDPEPDATDGPETPPAR